MNRHFNRIYAPSTLCSFLRVFTCGHIRQLDAVTSRLLTELPAQSPVLVPADTGEYVFVDVDDTIIEVHGHQKQGASFGYSGVRGLNALLAAVTTRISAPVVVAQRLRRDSCGSPRGAGRLIADVITTTRHLPAMAQQNFLVRTDSVFYGRPSIPAALTAGSDVSVTVPMTGTVKRAVTTIADNQWQMIRYTDAIFDADTQTWISSAEVAEVPFTAFASKPEADQVPGRLVVRRIPELNKKNMDQPSLFDLHRFHAEFTTADPDLLDTVAADKTHRQHAVIKQVNADLKNSAWCICHPGSSPRTLPWFVCAVMAFNLTRTAGIIAAGVMAKATTATIRRQVIATPARVARRPRGLVLHLPEGWKWAVQSTRLFTHAHSRQQVSLPDPSASFGYQDPNNS